MSASSPVTLRWVPGTLDRVRLDCALGQVQLPLSSVQLHLGRDVLRDLYLVGRHTVTLSASEQRDLLDALGCTNDVFVAPVLPAPLTLTSSAFD